MSDLRNLDLNATDGGLKVNSLVRNAEALTAGSANNKEYFGFYVDTVGGAWTFNPIDAKTTITFTPTANIEYPYHCSSITPHGSGVGHGNLGGNVNQMVDAFDDMTFSGTAVTTATTLTVAIGNSATLTSDSSVIPLVGQQYNYSYTISSYSAATTATITMGGTTLYDKAAIGTYTGSFTATTVAPLAIIVTTTATADLVVENLSVTRKK